MQWELLDGRKFEQAVVDSGGVCVLPIGPLERHGGHMPLGTDCKNAHKIACLASEQEPVVVFPEFYLSQVCESKGSPGTVAIRPELVMQVLRNLYEEIYRNGFSKIIVLNGHGGNSAMLQLMGQSDLDRVQDYMVYQINWWDTDDEAFKKIINDDCDGRPYGHACEWETSVTMYLVGEDTVDLNNAPEETVTMLDRTNGVDRQAFAGINWFSICPECYVGNARFASFERGKKYVEHNVGKVVEKIRAIKADKVMPELQKEYYKRSHTR